MAKIKYLFFLVAALFLLSLGSCTKYGYIDGGKANGVHDCTMWEYFHKDSYNWDSTILMIERAGLRSLFDGTGEHKQITFFGLTNLSIERHIRNHNKNLSPSSKDYWRGVKDIPVAQCQDIIEKLVVPRRFMLDDVPRGRRVQENEDGVTVWKNIDGMHTPCIRGELFVWTVQSDWAGMDKVGAVTLWIASENKKGTLSEVIASSDIQTTNGVVHSLGYDFRFINF